MFRVLEIMCMLIKRDAEEIILYYDKYIAKCDVCGNSPAPYLVCKNYANIYLDYKLVVICDDPKCFEYLKLKYC